MTFCVLPLKCAIRNRVLAMRIELADLENGKGAFRHVYAPNELSLRTTGVQLPEPTVSEILSWATRACKRTSFRALTAGM